MGNRRRNLGRAIAALCYSGSNCVVSTVVESKPWGYDSDNAFLNVGVAIEMTIAPHEVLNRIHHIERRLGSESHRDAMGNYVDRLIDIDIMAIDGDDGAQLTINSPTLQVPHPHLHDRQFFREPYMELKEKFTRKKIR